MLGVPPGCSLLRSPPYPAGLLPPSPHPPVRSPSFSSLAAGLARMIGIGSDRDMAGAGVATLSSSMALLIAATIPRPTAPSLKHLDELAVAGSEPKRESFRERFRSEESAMATPILGFPKSRSLFFFYIVCFSASISGFYKVDRNSREEEWVAFREGKNSRKIANSRTESLDFSGIFLEKYNILKGSRERDGRRRGKGKRNEASTSLVSRRRRIREALPSFSFHSSSTIVRI